MNNISHLRQANNLTQTKFAEQLNISTSQVCQYEAGSRKPQINMAPKMAKILNCSIEDIVLCFCDEGEGS